MGVINNSPIGYPTPGSVGPGENNTVPAEERTTFSRDSIPPSNEADQKLNESFAEQCQNMVEMAESSAGASSPIQDATFICSEENYKGLGPQVKELVDAFSSFNISSYLSGGRTDADRSVAEGNEKMLLAAREALTHAAEDLVSKTGCTSSQAYRQILGAVDKFDQEQGAYKDTKKTQASTFGLRTALLLASQGGGGDLESWMTYTKSGKPPMNMETRNKELWKFLDNWKNLIPEAHAAMAKFSEGTIVNAKALENKFQDRQYVLLKGGFGAGKTSLARSIYEDLASGIMAPDAAKRAVRQPSPTISHDAAHKQASQLAYSLSTELTGKTKGTLVYDSSMRDPAEVEKALVKCNKAGKALVIQDIARNEMVRALAVLGRSVGGEDPRIPYNDFIDAAIDEKMTRADCMKVVLKAVESKENKTAAGHEYHFYCCNDQGEDRQEVLTIKTGKVTAKPEYIHRMEKEGVHYDQENGKVTCIYTSEESARPEIEAKFEEPVSGVISQLSPAERAKCKELFGGRQFHLDANAVVTDAESLYNALSDNQKEAVPKSSFIQAFAEISPKARDAFFNEIQGKSDISYLDLPLRVAMNIHKDLKTDPFI